VRELFRQRAARAEQEGLESSGGDPEDVCDLLVGTALELAQDDRLALLRRDLRERGQQLPHRRAFPHVTAGRDLAVELDFTRARLIPTKTLLDRVARDRQQPVRRLPGSHSLLERSV